MNAGPFRLYPREAHWWSNADYGHVLSVVERLGAKRVLEFGPGSSTLALIEGGAETIVSCEDDPIWLATADRLVERFPQHVLIEPYVWSDPIRIPAIEVGQRFDLALVDGPALTPRRRAVVDYCMTRCSAVLVPLEACGGNSVMFDACEYLAGRHSWRMTITLTGPLACGFALLRPAP